MAGANLVSPAPTPLCGVLRRSHSPARIPQRVLGRGRVGCTTDSPGPLECPSSIGRGSKPLPCACCFFTHHGTTKGGTAHHSIAVFITTLLTNFAESPKGEVRRIPIPRTSVNKGKRKGWVLRDPALLATASDLLLVGRLPQACTLLLRLARSLASIFERHAGERFGPLLEEALVCFVALLKDLKDPAGKILVGLHLTLNALPKGPSNLLGCLVVPLTGGDPVLTRYPGAFLGALGVSLGDPSQVLEIRLGHHGRGHFIDTSVGSGLVQFQIFTYHAPGAAKHL